MADSKFKRALNYSFQQEMDEIPRSMNWKENMFFLTNLKKR